jgi:hypothetical protein
VPARPSGRQWDLKAITFRSVFARKKIGQIRRIRGRTVDKLRAKAGGRVSPFANRPEVVGPPISTLDKLHKSIFDSALEKISGQILKRHTLFRVVQKNC